MISDVVEALLGAAHVDGGFGDGQDAALNILKPITNLLKTSDDPNCTERLSNPKTGKVRVAYQPNTHRLVIVISFIILSIL